MPTPEALKRSYDMKAYAFLPKEKLADIVPFLEDVLKYDYATGWKRLLQKLHGFFSDRFVSDWEKKTGLEWKEWSKQHFCPAGRDKILFFGGKS